MRSNFLPLIIYVDEKKTKNECFKSAIISKARNL